MTWNYEIIVFNKIDIVEEAKIEEKPAEKKDSKPEDKGKNS